MRLILLGPPGSGKGTQGERVTAAFGYPRISTGDLLREAVRQGTGPGRQAETVMNRGELVPDELVIDMVRERIAQPDCRDGYILDGFPRTVPQAVAMTGLDPDRPELVIDIRLDDETVVDRLSSRRICPECGAIRSMKAAAGESACDACGGRLIQRDDDQPAVIRKRLAVYHAQTEPLIDFYRESSIYRAVDGSGDIEGIFTAIRDLIETRRRDIGAVKTT